MSEAVTVPSLMMMSSIESDESQSRDTHTHTTLKFALSNALNNVLNTQSNTLNRQNDTLKTQTSNNTLNTLNNALNTQTSNSTLKRREKEGEQRNERKDRKEKKDLKEKNSPQINISGPMWEGMNTCVYMKKCIVCLQYQLHVFKNIFITSIQIAVQHSVFHQNQDV